MREELKNEILELIARNGALSLYRIARAITDQRFLSMSDQTGDVLKELERENLIKNIDDVFSVTPEGKQVIDAKKTKTV